MNSSQSITSLDTNLSDVLPMDKWSVVELEKGEFDCIPNLWFHSVTEAYYYPPGFSAATAKRLAKNLELPPDNWEIVPITLKKRNFSTFEKGFEKAISYRHEVSSTSEPEQTGVGQRKTKPPTRLSPSPIGGKKALKDTALCEDNDFEKTPRNSPQENTPKSTVVRSILFTAPKTSALSRPVSCSAAELRNPSPKETSKTAPSPTDETCNLKKKNLKHRCAFDYGPINLVNLAQSVCIITRLLEGIIGEINSLKGIMYGQEDETENNIDSDDEAVESIKGKIPFYKYEDLLAFDKELASNKELATRLQMVLKAKASTTNPSICATSIVKQLISRSLSKHIVWKGKADGPKHSFESLKLKSVVTRVVKSCYPKVKVDEIVEKAVSRWLTQTASNIKKGRVKSDTPVKQNMNRPALESIAGSSTQPRQNEVQSMDVAVSSDSEA